MLIFQGVALLLACLAAFSLFSMYAPKGREAMGGLAGAAVASFLVEAVYLYIGGEQLGIAFLGDTGKAAGSMGGVAAAALVALKMGVNPVYALIGAAAVADQKILPGFLAGYLIGLFGPYLEKKLPEGVDIIGGAFILAPLARLIAVYSAPAVDGALGIIGQTVTEATNQNPIVMGLLLGGLIKMICTSPLSSMALTAMLGLTGLPMGIAAIACFGGSFTNGIIFRRLGLGDSSKVVAVMLEPLTQADVVTANPIPIYLGNFVGGALAGLAAAMLGIVNNAPGTASPIPGLIVPFAHNPAGTMCLALFFAAIGGAIGGLIVSQIFKSIQKRPKCKNKPTPAVA